LKLDKVKALSRFLIKYVKKKLILTKFKIYLKTTIPKDLQSGLISSVHFKITSKLKVQFEFHHHLLNFE